MKIVATSDTHFPFSQDLIEEGDVFIHAGDLMYSGLPNEWYPRVDSLKALEGYRTKLLVPGNHDYHLQNYAGLASSELRKAGVFVLTDYRPTVELDGVKYLGIPFVTGLPGWAFNREEEWVLDWLRNVTKDFKPDVVISHAPVYGILDAVYPDKEKYRDQLHVGGQAMNRWFYAQDIAPKLWVHGHIHESYGAEKVEDTMFMNVAMCDRNYEQVNPAITAEI